jgi:hypothetical protein
LTKESLWNDHRPSTYLVPCGGTKKSWSWDWTGKLEKDTPKMPNKFPI